MTNRLHKVEIGMPVYNGESFLEQALDSILQQTYSDFKLIISDNASTDSTSAICEDYARRDSRIRYERNETNLGAIGNFNRAFELSDAKYFKWAAYDDVCHPTFLERCVEVLDNEPDIAWCHSRSMHIDQNGRALDEPIISYTSRECDKSYKRFDAILFDPNGCLDSYGLIRSRIMRETNLLIPAYGAEKVFMAELSLWGGFREIPETLFKARVHAQGSGNLDSADEQREFVAPQTSPNSSVRLQLLCGYLKAIRRANISWYERLRCGGVLLKYLLQTKKWKRILLGYMRGAGVGGRNVRRLEKLDEENSSSTESRFSISTTTRDDDSDHPVKHSANDVITQDI